VVTHFEALGDANDEKVSGFESDELLIDVVSNADCLVIRFVGALDVSSTSKAQEVALEHLGRSNAPLVVLDVADVTFCGSCGLGALVHLSMIALACERHAVLRGPRPSVQRLIDLLDLHEILIVEDSRRNERVARASRTRRFR
jgi:anti-anti-sigma factor